MVPNENEVEVALPMASARSILPSCSTYLGDGGGGGIERQCTTQTMRLCAWQYDKTDRDRGDINGDTRQQGSRQRQGDKTDTDRETRQTETGRQDRQRQGDKARGGGGGVHGSRVRGEG